MDPGGSLILLDQVIFLCLHILPWHAKGGRVFTVIISPVCRCNDRTHLVGLQSLQHVPNHHWGWNGISSRDRRDRAGASPIAPSQRWRCLELGFILWFNLPWWGGPRRVACSEFPWRKHIKRRRKQRQSSAPLCYLLWCSKRLLFSSMWPLCCLFYMWNKVCTPLFHLAQIYSCVI